MTPAMASGLASRLYTYRWWFLAASLIGFATGAALLVIWPSLMQAVVPLFGPLVVVPWALLCACMWFHPERGNMRSSSSMFSKLPGFLHGVIRWYASLFLTLFLIVGMLVWPALVIGWR